MNKEKLMNKFIDKISDGVIFYKTPFLPSEINKVFNALRIEEDLKTNIEIYNTDDPIDVRTKQLLQKILGIRND